MTKRKAYTGDEEIYAKSHLHVEAGNPRERKVCLTFINLEKSFDRVSRYKLMHILKERNMSTKLDNFQ